MLVVYLKRFARVRPTTWYEVLQYCSSTLYWILIIGLIQYGYRTDCSSTRTSTVYPYLLVVVVLL